MVLIEIETKNYIYIGNLTRSVDHHSILNKKDSNSLGSA